MAVQSLKELYCEHVLLPYRRYKVKQLAKQEREGSAAAASRCASPVVTRPPIMFMIVEENGQGTLVSEELTPRKPGHLRVVCISDTHLQHDLIPIPDGDVLIHSGDLLFQDRGRKMGTKGIERLTRFNTFLGTLPHKHKIVIGGNHDLILEELGREKAQEILSNALYLENSLVEIGGVRFYGTPISLGASPNRAFQSGEFVMSALEALPSRVDVLITHGPAKGVMRDYIDRANPRYHVFGHMHNFFGSKKKGRIVSINASSLNGDYMPAFPAVVLDLQMRPA